MRWRALMALQLPAIGCPVLAGMSCTVQQNTNLMGANWITSTNIIGNSPVTQFTLPATNKTLFFRVRQP